MIDEKLREILVEFENHGFCSNSKCLHCQAQLKKSTDQIKALVVESLGEEKKDYYVTGAQDEGHWVKLTDMDMGINYHIAEMKKKFK